MKEIEKIFSNKSRMQNKKKEEIKKIFIDNREKNSLVPSELINLGLEIEFKQLEVGDYLIGNTVIERKTINDFLSSMINKRMISQIENLKINENPLLILEGISERSLYK
ncbi:MAG: ERCC4 domain-containing protein, partial [Candidatus Pacearchaeota archaeon]